MTIKEVNTINKAYLGPLRNLEGQVYGEIYDTDQLDAFQKDHLRSKSTDVWNQVDFMSLDEYQDYLSSLTK